MIYRVNLVTDMQIGVEVDIDDTGLTPQEAAKLAAERAVEEAEIPPLGICCSGYSQDWSRDEGEQLDAAEVVDPEGTVLWHDPDAGAIRVPVQHPLAVLLDTPIDALVPGEEKEWQARAKEFLEGLTDETLDRLTPNLVGLLSLARKASRERAGQRVARQ